MVVECVKRWLTKNDSTATWYANYDSRQADRHVLDIKEASNGIAALELVNQFQFDIILLDIDMPLLNGIDTTKSIRKNGQTIPIIAVTTNDSIESVDTYIQIGMNHCLSKPVDLHLLEQTLIRFLSTSQSDQDVRFPYFL
ncbi:hypothetical protein HPULCUR_006005 [Helicostylum pulchrum]|uniref:Response regulatory domain-containing protein n=1 Tax=Helicostylum pulchrum TaxID=562976 RepID=A0ABP9Y0N7_9FUNG